jgi:glycosyltransferase involved in cell wall biosynthesis
MNEIGFVVRGRLDQLTGGYLFDRRLVDGLRANGQKVRVLELPATGFDALPDGAAAVVDGLALTEFDRIVAAELPRLRLVAFVHHPLALETGLAPVEAMRLAAIEAALLPRFRGIICPSRTTARALRAYGVSPDRIAIVAPGTAPARRYWRRRRSRVRALLCVASVIPRKGHAVLIAALARLRDLDWKLLCVGSLERDPATVREVRAMVSAFGLGARVTLAGEWAPHLVARAYRAADAFVLPSYYEGYGMVCTEALAHGLPLITTKAGAIPETMPPGTGMLVAPGDRAALARALRRLIAEPALAARLAAGARAANRHYRDWADATREWETAFARLAALDPPE